LTAKDEGKRPMGFFARGMFFKATQRVSQGQEKHRRN